MAEPFTWANIIRSLSVVCLVGLGTADYGFGVLAKEVPDFVYILLAAIALGVDPPALRKVFLNILSGGSGKGDNDR